MLKRKLAAVIFSNASLFAASKDANNSTLVYELGLWYNALNQEKEAVRYFELAVEKGYKEDLNYKENPGMAHLAFDIDKGVEILNAVLAKKPNDSEIVLQIAEACYKAKNFQTAANTFYKVYLDDPTDKRRFTSRG